MPALTKIIQKVVPEVMERKFSVAEQLKRSPLSGAVKRYELKLKDDLPGTIYRDSKIKAKKQDYVEVTLYDTMDKSIVTDGPLSSMKVRICALKGEFASNNNGGWSTAEFKNNIFQQRQDKAMLLKGETVIILNNGVGRISNIAFTDNSKRTRSGHYKLGVIALSPANQEHVTEAVSNAFRVKESRGNQQKHFPPTLTPKDKIWRLVNISKGGNVQKRLSRDLQIETVEDLLRFNNQTDLQKTFGPSSRKLRQTLKHAKSCYPPPPPVTRQGQNCHSHNHDKKHVEETGAQAQTFPDPMGSLQQQDQLVITGTDFIQPSASTPHFAGAAYSYDQLGDLAQQLFDGNLFGYF